MWRLIKADLRYASSGLAFGYGICLLFLIGGFIFDLGGFYALLGQVMITFFITIAIVGSEWDKEKRDRLHAMLPVPRRQVSIGRLLFVLLALVGTWPIQLVRLSYDWPLLSASVLWDVLAVNAFILAVVAFFSIVSDLNHFGTWIFKVVAWLVLVVVVASVIALSVNGFVDWRFFAIGESIRKSPIDAAANVAIVLLLNWINHRIFLRRKFYLA